MKFGSPFESIFREFNARKPYYIDDWVSAFKSRKSFAKVMSATIFMFFTSTIPAIAFASYMMAVTESQFGVVEVLLATSISGILYSIFAGQPLVIMGVTGPIAVFSRTIFSIVQSFDGVSFLGFMFWISIWAGIMHILCAIFNVVQLVSLVTRYSAEIFDLLIAAIYFTTAIADLVSAFNNSESMDKPLLSVILALLTFWLASVLSKVRHSLIYNHTFRVLVADYAVPVAVIVVSCVRLIGPLSRVDVDLLSVPESLRPTDLNRSSFLVNPFSVPVWAIFLAIVPAFILTILFFFDHTVTSLIAQAPRYNLKKPPAYNLDFAVLGVILILTSAFGLPFYNGLIPQAPLHVRSLSHITEEAGPHRKEVFHGAEEQRVSNLLQSILCGIVVVIPSLLKLMGNIPISVLDGLFLYMGAASFRANHLVERTFVLLFVSNDKNRDAAAPYSWPAIVEHGVSIKKTAIFTLTQIVFLVSVYFLMQSPAALLFPVFLVIMAPFRLIVLPSKKILRNFAYSKDELLALDGAAEFNIEDDHDVAVQVEGDDNIGEDLELARIIDDSIK
eukprot:Partr_v1_DN26842_c3_g1_i1_m40580 putative solute carrier family 4